MNSNSPNTPPITEEDLAPVADPSLVVFDTSDLTRNPSAPAPTYKDRRRELDRKLAPSFTPRPMGRAQRRKAGDYRTARQIISDDMAAGRVK